MSDYAMVVAEPGGPERFERRDIRSPAPGSGEACVRHSDVGLNFLDVYHRSGTYPWSVPRDLVPGSEASGVIEAVGAGGENVKVGDRVAYTDPLDAYASVRTLRADRLVRLQESVPDDIAASLMLKVLTAHYLINDSFRATAGMTILVHAAAGGVGLLLGQWLAAKCVTAIGTAGGVEKATLAAANGYAHVIDYSADDFVDRVTEITDGAGVHAVYDGVGRDTWRGSLACLRPRGTFVCFGQASGPIEGFSMDDLAKGSFSATRPVLFHFIADAQELRSRARDLFAAVADGTLRSEVRQRYALTDVTAAHTVLEGRRTAGPTILMP